MKLVRTDSTDNGQQFRYDESAQERDARRARRAERQQRVNDARAAYEVLQRSSGDPHLVARDLAALDVLAEGVAGRVLEPLGALVRDVRELREEIAQSANEREALSASVDDLSEGYRLVQSRFSALVREVEALERCDSSIRDQVADLGRSVNMLRDDVSHGRFGAPKAVEGSAEVGIGPKETSSAQLSDGLSRLAVESEALRAQAWRRLLVARAFGAVLLLIAFGVAALVIASNNLYGLGVPPSLALVAIFYTRAASGVYRQRVVLTELDTLSTALVRASDGVVDPTHLRSELKYASRDHLHYRDPFTRYSDALRSYFGLLEKDSGLDMATTRALQYGALVGYITPTVMLNRGSMAFLVSPDVERRGEISLQARGSTSERRSGYPFG
jgi:hypothetical protein